jgi:DnaJ-domain-containing protein 1
MNDHFATLAQPRRPLLDAAALKEAFHRATAQQHPDVAGGSGDPSAALNAAYAVLREPAARLRHLLEVELPGDPILPASIPAAAADLFMRIAALRQACAAFLKKETAALNPLTRALLAGEKSALRRDLEAGLAALESAESAALDELRALDAAWENHDRALLDRLAAAQQKFAFLGKWRTQLREDLFKLSA